MNTDEKPNGAGHTLRDLNSVSYGIVGAGYQVSNVLGIGFLEKVYENALSWELRKAGMTVSQQVGVPVHYDGRIVGEYIPDLVVQEAIIVEVKAVSALDPAHRAQCVNYLRATGLGLPCC